MKATNKYIKDRINELRLTKEERSAFCSADKGNTYPPCWNPKHKFEDCKQEYDQRMEFRKRLKEMRDQRLEQNPTETYFS